MSQQQQQQQQQPQNQNHFPTTTETTRTATATQKRNKPLTSTSHRATARDVASVLCEIRQDTPSVLFYWKGKTLIGSGTYAVVYKAQCINLPVPTSRRRSSIHQSRLVVGDQYAVKIIHKENLITEKHWRCVAHEIAILQRCHSPHCIELFDVFQDENDIYLVMELVEGGELFDIIASKGQMTEVEAKVITAQLIQALVYLHQMKIVHRDLKPENILLVKSSLKVKLIDFGFAKFIGNVTDVTAIYRDSEPPWLEDDNSPTSPFSKPSLGSLSPEATIPSSTSELVVSTPLGTVGYLAPEIIKTLLLRGVSPRVTTRVDLQKQDIFSLGVIVYAMLGGELPYPTELKPGILERIYRGLVFPKKYFGHISREGLEFVQWLLQTDRRQRPLATELLQHPWLRDVSLPTTTASPRNSHQTPSYTVSTPVLPTEYYDQMRQAENALDEEADQEFKSSSDFLSSCADSSISSADQRESPTTSPMLRPTTANTTELAASASVPLTITIKSLLAEAAAATVAAASSFQAPVLIMPSPALRKYHLRQRGGGIKQDASATITALAASMAK